jgi:hypothetical protein
MYRYLQALKTEPESPGRIAWDEICLNNIWLQNSIEGEKSSSLRGMFVKLLLLLFPVVMDLSAILNEIGLPTSRSFLSPLSEIK